MPAPFHATLDEPTARDFLRLEALSSTVSDTTLSLMLKKARIPAPAEGWSAQTVASARLGFASASTPYATGVMNGDARHALSTEAAQDPRLVAAVRQTLEKSVGSRARTGAQLQYLAAYTGDEALFLRQGDVQDLAMRRREAFSSVAFSADWLKNRPSSIREALFTDMALFLLQNSAHYAALQEGFSLWRSGGLNSLNVHAFPLLPLMELFSGRWDDAEKNIALLKRNPGEVLGPATSAMAHLLAMRCEEAIRDFTEARKILRRVAGHRTLQLEGTFGVAFQLARFVKNDPAELPLMRRETERLLHDGAHGAPGFAAILALDHLRRGEAFHAENMLLREDGTRADLFSTILFRCACVKVAPDRPAWADAVKSGQNRLSGLLPLAADLFADAARLLPPTRTQSSARDTDALPAHINLVALFQEKAPWEAQLETLEAALAPRQRGASSDAHRLVWLLDPETATAQPVEQALDRKGNWSAGRQAGLKRLCEQADSLEWLTEADRRALFAIVRGQTWHYGPAYELNQERLLPLLANHPLLFDSETRAPVTLKAAPAELLLEENDKGCTLQLTHGSTDSGATLERTGENQYVVRVVPQKLRAAFAFLGPEGLTAPREALGRVIALARNLDSVSVKTDIAAEERPASAVPVFQLRQRPGGFEGRLMVRPFGAPDTPVFRPGEGPRSLLATVPVAENESRPARVSRNLQAETDAEQALLEACPTLAEGIGSGRWDTNNPERLLELLDELHESQVPCSVEWPEGEKLRLAGELSPAAMRVHVGRAKSCNWFAFSGDARIDENRVLDVNALLEHLDECKGRFLPLENGEFLALTLELKRKLERLRLLSSPGKKGEGRLVHPLVAPALEENVGGMNVAADIDWERALTRMRKAFSSTPAVPAALQAGLRDYQREGFEWLARLARWGVGGCLADDMGLGKTVQTIAVMLLEATRGPCLVVAPTSVCANWQAELARFAPSLEVLRLGDADRRDALIASLAAGQVLIVGYGLLHNEEKALSARRWSMVVFDEAQAIKNAGTKRARAGKMLEADFRVALTGTPIENRVDDLWSLFNIINPGLLGTHETFRKRFGSISPGGAAARTLKSLIRPFMLRRLKSHVLDELPTRTEQTLLIEPSASELAFYEALRRRAMESVQRLKTQNSGEERLQILTELTRLRLACCHTSLAGGGGKAYSASSKTLRFIELIEELCAAGHKVLAFSQFVGHLALVRGELDKRAIPYQYLDGATPEKDRAAAVYAFQGGTGDVFLISLRAGGQGLNLTAADYVIHLDPWWNPAVEDQASDRAHRIGQLRPVTIYRMVMAHSVEEKILALHREKRELAADFLEGAETAVASLNNEELIALLRP